MKYDTETVVLENEALDVLDDAIEHAIRRELTDNNRFSGNYVSPLSYEKESNQFFVQHPHLSHVRIEVNKSISAVTEKDLGNEFLVCFDRGDVTKPILLHKIQTLSLDANTANNAIEKQFISTNGEIKLQCGKASITLTENGKIMLRGTYIVSRSSGANKLKGGSISLN